MFGPREQDLQHGRDVMVYPASINASREVKLMLIEVLYHLYDLKHFFKIHYSFTSLSRQYVNFNSMSPAASPTSNTTVEAIKSFAIKLS